MVKRGFTLIELLVVIAIIAVLMGLTLASLPAVRAALKRKKTETILATVRVSLETTAASTGSRPSPAPHPLAGTAAPRSLFVRSGTTLATTGEALECERLDWLQASVRDRAVQPDDLFAGRVTAGDCPALFGLPRKRMGVIGTASLLTLTHRHIPAPTPLTDANSDGITDPPYDGTKYADRLHLVSAGLAITVTAGGSGYTLPPTVTISGGGGSGARATAELNQGQVVGIALESPGIGFTGDPTITITGGGGSGATAIAKRYSDDASRQAVEQSLGLSGRDEVLNLGAIFTTSGATYIFDDLLWSDGQTAMTWTPGSVKVGGAWQRYRIRGTAIYDSYGTEILYSVTSAGAIRLESAGRDGYFRWKPDASGGYSVSDLAGDPSPQRDGSIDNLSMVTGE